MASYFIILDEDNFVSRAHICPENERARFLGSPERKIPVEKDVFDRISAGRNGRFRHESGDFVFYKDEDNASLMDTRARTQRDALLNASDWTQLPDVPLTTKEVWATYRQALRDITLQPGYPHDVDWPTSPGG